MMKRLKIKYLVVLLAFMAIGTNLSAQCFSFAKTIGKPKLGEYQHDGNYNATLLGEGEYAELIKTFFSGEKYRLAISKVESLPNINVKVLDDNGTVLFDNKDHDYALVWDFDVQTTQNLVIQLKVLSKEKASDVQMKGCIAILFGILPGKK